jgi:DNA-binding Lrp family transcriptional regulator
MDRTDVSLCLSLLSNSRIPYHELAAKFGLSINAVHKRIGAMVASGMIRAFTARPSLLSIGAITVWVFGRSESDHMSDLHNSLQADEHTYWVANSGGGYLYVGGHLRSLSELDAYVEFVKREGEIDGPSVGIVPLPVNPFPKEELSDIDYQIIASLHRDSRKPVSDVASDVRASSKTVHRRLERMIEKGLVDLSIDWYPDVSNDIVALGHIEMGPHADRIGVLEALRSTFSQNILVEMLFSNLPSLLVLFLWTNSMRQMEDLRGRIEAAAGVKSVTLNVLQIGYMSDTWRDNLVSVRGKGGSQSGP